MKRKIYAMISAILMLLMSITNVAFAATNGQPSPSVTIQFSDPELQRIYENKKREFENLTDSEVCDLLVEKYGLTRADVEALYQEYQIRSNISFYGFPSNPTMGQNYAWKVGPINLPTDQDKALMSVIEAISSAKVPGFGSAAAIGAAIRDLIPSGGTVTIIFNYTYGYTNDGVLGWTPGYIDVKVK